MSRVPSCFRSFKEDISSIDIPPLFNYPFYYTPSDISLLATKELQEYLNTDSILEHNFGLDPDNLHGAIGKMIGVLVVKAENGEIGYLAAFSGKLSIGDGYPHFVPSIYHKLDEEGIYKSKEAIINQLNRRIEVLEKDPSILSSKEDLYLIQAEAKEQLLYERIKLKLEKRKRTEIRKELKSKHSDRSIEESLEYFKNESLKQQWLYKYIKRRWEERISMAEAKVTSALKELTRLKAERKERSIKLQEWLFDQYQFYNANGEIEALKVLFKDHPLERPPSGAGDCAAPKLFQYAYIHKLKPLAIAEFWWGISPSSKIRKHQVFYPACKGKCGPILEHMLKGLSVEENPLISDNGSTKEIKIIYDDEDIVVINKPSELLSVPGKNNMESVASKMKEKYPQATGPLIIHRLDMSTSGIMILAKNPKAYAYIQKQFISRTVQKRYVAILDGVLKKDNGTVDLPLMLDFYDRPRQMVSLEKGKAAITKYQVVDHSLDTTRVLFYPLTGRTHQLRVHAAHKDGLNTPIKGDDLYGVRKDRLYLHAEWVSFKHPATEQQVEFMCPPEF